MSFSREGKEWDDHGVFTYYLLKGLKGEADSNDNGTNVTQKQGLASKCFT